MPENAIQTRPPAGGSKASIIRVCGLMKSYRQISSRESLTAIEAIDLEVAPGERVCIVGPTGSGKSTFFRIVCGLEPPSAGSVEVQGHCPYSEFNWYRGKLGVIFQEDCLLPWRTALENVLLGLEFLDPSPKDSRQRALDWLERLGLKGSETAYPGELSGGMRQRVAMARAFVATPQIVLADEAFSKLDPVTSRRLRQDFKALCIAQKTTLLLVTHQLEEALELGERIIVFGRPGRIVAEILPGEARNEKERLALRKSLETALGDSLSFLEP